jgi:hypothetical protein
MVQVQSEDSVAALFTTDASGRAYVCDPLKGGVQEITLTSYLGSNDQCPVLNDLERAAAGGHDAARPVHDTSIIKTAPMFLREVMQGKSSPRLLVLDHDGLGHVLSTSTWDVRAIWLPPHGVRWTAPYVLEMAIEREQLIVAWDGAENVSTRLSLWDAGPVKPSFSLPSRQCLLSGRSLPSNSGIMGCWRCNCMRRRAHAFRDHARLSCIPMAWSWACSHSVFHAVASPMPVETHHVQKNTPMLVVWPRTSGVLQQKKAHCFARKHPTALQNPLCLCGSPCRRILLSESVLSFDAPNTLLFSIRLAQRVR